MGLLEFFEECLFPLAVEGGKCLFYIALTTGAYLLIRGNANDSIKKIKSATIGYFLLKLIKVYVEMIDTFTNDIKF